MFIKYGTLSTFRTNIIITSGRIFVNRINRIISKSTQRQKFAVCRNFKIYFKADIRIITEIIATAAPTQDIVPYIFFESFSLSVAR